MSAGLILLALALPLSIAGTNIALCALSVLALGRARDPKPWRVALQPVFYAVAAYCAAGLICALLGVDPERSLKAWTKDLHKLWVVALLLVAFGEDEPKPALAAALGAGFALSSLVGLWQVLTQTADWSTRWTRAHGFVHPVTYGCQLTFALLGALCFYLRTPEPLVRYRRLIIGASALFVAALVVSQTRTAAVAAVAGAVAIGLADRRARKWALGILAAVVAILIIWELMPTGGRTLGALLSPAPEGGFNNQRTRLVLWDVARRVFIDHPLTGVGPGSYGLVFPRYFSGTLEGQRVWGAAHNLYLHQLAERGILGLTALLAVFGAMLLSAWRSERRAKTAWTLWAWSGLCAFAAMNLTETAFQTEQLATLALFVWAAGSRRARP